MASENKARLHAVVSGRVQGVGFRYFVREQALGLGLDGWVRNRRNGRVEAVAEGEQEALERFLRGLQRGPRASQVTDVDVRWEAFTGEFEGFRIRLTF